LRHDPKIFKGMGKAFKSCLIVKGEEPSVELYVGQFLGAKNYYWVRGVRKQKEDMKFFLRIGRAPFLLIL